MAAAKQSISHSLPRHFEIPLFILVSAALLWIGLSRPLFEVEKGFLWMHWRSCYSVLQGITSLKDDGQYFLAGLVFFFSLVFPICKLIVLGLLWVVPLREERRTAVLHWLSVLGKWSMLDVFAVAILVVAVKLGPLAKVHAENGVYFFCLAILLSMVTTMYAEWLLRRSH
jgi:paraquat-inducible protein A